MDIMGIFLDLTPIEKDVRIGGYFDEVKRCKIGLSGV